MALIITGSGVASIKGKIGGTVYSNSISGQVAKSLGRRSKRQSTQLLISQSLLTIVQQLWTSLSEPERQLWNDYSLYKPTAQKRNPNRFLNGQQIFVLYNYARLSVLNATEIVPNFATTPPLSTTLTLTNTAGTLTVDSLDGINETTDFVVFKVSSRMKQSQKLAKGGVKFISTIFASTTSCDITAAYINLFGAVPDTGDTVQIDYQFYNTNSPNWTNKITRITGVQ